MDNPQMQNPFGQIQPTQFPQLSLDSIMNNAINAQIAQKQIEKANLDIQNQSGEMNLNAGAFGVTPADLANPQLMAQAGQQPQMQPQVGQGQGMFSNPGQQMGDTDQNGQPLDPQHQATLNGLRSLIAMRRFQAQQGMQQQQAGLQKTQAETAKTSAEAELTGAQVSMLGGANAVIDNHVNQIRSGNETLDDLSNMGRGELANAIKVGVTSKLAAMGVNTNALNNIQTKNKATATLQGDQGQTLGASAGTLEDILNQASTLVPKLSVSQFQAVNDAYTKGLKAIKNDPTATEFLVLMNEAKGKYANVISMGKGATDIDKQSAGESIGRGLDPQAYAAMQKAVTFAARSSVSRFNGRGFNEPSQATIPSINSQADYDKLAKGQQYIWNGRTGTKK